MKQDITAYYRISDDFARYTVTSKQRIKQLKHLWHSYRSFFGKHVLDLACGGGVLGFELEKAGHVYVGVDVNPDMVRSATMYARDVGSKNRFVLADVTKKKVKGKFDTVTILGNALCHFTAPDFARILANLDRATYRGSYFLVEYRDVVGLLARREWWKRKTIRRGDRGVRIVTTRYDTEHGTIEQDHAQIGGRRRVRFSHAIWSPFILQTLMAAHAWYLVRSDPSPSQLSSEFVEVYKRVRRLRSIDPSREEERANESLQARIRFRCELMPAVRTHGSLPAG